MFASQAICLLVGIICVAAKREQSQMRTDSLQNQVNVTEGTDKTKVARCCCKMYECKDGSKAIPRDHPQKDQKICCKERDDECDFPLRESYSAWYPDEYCKKQSTNEELQAAYKVFAAQKKHYESGFIKGFLQRSLERAFHKMLSGSGFQTLIVTLETIIAIFIPHYPATRAPQTLTMQGHATNGGSKELKRLTFSKQITTKFENKALQAAFKTNNCSIVLPAKIVDRLGRALSWLKECTTGIRMKEVKLCEHASLHNNFSATAQKLYTNYDNMMEETVIELAKATLDKIPGIIMTMAARKARGRLTIQHIEKFLRTMDGQTGDSSLEYLKQRVDKLNDNLVDMHNHYENQQKDKFKEPIRIQVHELLGVFGVMMNTTGFEQGVESFLQQMLLFASNVDFKITSESPHEHGSLLETEATELDMHTIEFALDSHVDWEDFKDLLIGIYFLLVLPFAVLCVCWH